MNILPHCARQPSNGAPCCAHEPGFGHGAPRCAHEPGEPGFGHGVPICARQPEFGHGVPFLQKGFALPSHFCLV